MATAVQIENDPFRYLQRKPDSLKLPDFEYDSS